MRKRSRQEAPAEGISLSAQLSQAAAWMRVWDECQRLGMDTSGVPSTRTGLDIVLDFIRGRAAPQEAREPDIEALAEAVHDAYLATCARLGWDVKPANRVPYAELSEDSKELDRASVRAVLAGLAAARPAPETREPDGWAIRMRDGSWRSTIYEDRETAERMAVKAREFFAARGDEDDEFDSIDVLPVYLGAPAPAEGRQVLALDAIRDVLGIDYDEDSAMWYLPAEPAPIECATLDDALRAYAKMAAPASGEPSEAKATPLSDAAVARIIEAVEAHCGMGRGAWDMVAARDLVEGFAAALGADTLLTASCVWTVDEDGNYHTACDGMFIVLEGTPRENGMSFCCYCGRTLTEADDAYRLDMTAQAGGGDAAE